MTIENGIRRVETVESNITAYGNVSMAVDSKSAVHLIYYDAVNGDLKYASNRSGAWQVEIVDSQGDVGSNASIALDQFDAVHISYIDRTNQFLKYANNASGTWQLVILDGNGDFRSIGYNHRQQTTRIALDSFGKIHVAYRKGVFGNYPGKVWYLSN